MIDSDPTQRLAQVLRKMRLGRLADLPGTPRPPENPPTVLDELEIASSYLLFDLEATRRERDLLLEMLKAAGE